MPNIVDIVAPGWKCNPKDLEKGLKIIRSWGLEPRVPKKMFEPGSLYSSNDESRFQFLKSAFENRESDIVWCVRGGFGSMRLIPRLMKMQRPERKKLFIGLSDISTVHLFLNQVWQWPSVHGPMLDRLGARTPPPKFLKELKGLMTGETSSIEFTGLKPMNKAARELKQAEGVVSGGNLVTLHSSIKTQIEWQPRGKILFIEEIGERGYRIDRILEHFNQLGFWQWPAALVLGDFTACNEPDGKKTYLRVLKDFAEKQGFPVFTGIKSGHGPVQRPVPLGTRSILFGGAKARLECPWPV